MLSVATPQTPGRVHATETLALDPHAALRDDVRALGGILGRVIRRLSGEPAFVRIERVRALAKRAHHGDDDALSELRALLSALSHEEAAELTRAFATFLALANTAEQHHRLRRRRAYLRAFGPPQRGSCADALGRLAASGISADSLRETLSKQSVELVLTAHPTEVSRRTLLDKHARIAEALAERDRVDLSRAERAAWDLTLEREVEALWSTDALREQAPTPDEEAQAALLVIERTLWHALPRHLRVLDAALFDVAGVHLPLGAAPVRFGSWIGGDRDGNPYVDARVSERAVFRARALAADLTLRDVNELIGELSMVGSHATMRHFGVAGREPYRAFLRPLAGRLQEVRERALMRVRGEPTLGDELSSSELLDALLRVHEALVAEGLTEVASGRLLDLIRRVSAFGLSLVRLDVRQHARVIEGALSELTAVLGLGSYTGWSEQERLFFLRSELLSRRPLIPSDAVFSTLTSDLFDSLSLVTRVPEESLGVFVVSMANEASDVLGALVLQRALGVLSRQRVVPLFESLGSLERAPEVIERLLELPEARALFGDRFEVMLGYSDSAKDGSVLAASYALYRCQEALLEVGRRHGVLISFFHGRGGTVARGGGPTYLAVQALPAGALEGGLRVTEQGEMIHAKFGSIPLAERSLELYTTATLEATLRPPAGPSAAQRELLAQLTTRSRDAFRETVTDPEFLTYFHTVTPLSAFEGLNLGSRPTRRSAGTSIEELRAIPWIFAWAQTRLIAASWLGTGAALRWAYEHGHEEELEKLVRDVRFGRSLFELLEMVLAKTDPRVHASYDLALATPSQRALGERLRGELAHTRELVLRATGHARLLETQPVIERSIAVRSPYLLPMHLLQAELLKRRLSEPTDKTLQRAIRHTIFGIASGLRNTG